MTTNDLQFMIRFAKKFGRHTIALDIIELLINNNGEYIGSYRALAQKLKRNKNDASNIRKVCIWLAKQGIAYAQSTKDNDDYNTIIVMDDNWKESV